MSFSAPGPGKKARVFFFCRSRNVYVAAPPALVIACGSAAFNYNDKIETLTFKRVDMSDAEFEALPVVDSSRINRIPERNPGQ